MTGTVWSTRGTGVIIGGAPGSLLASASLFAAFASEGMERYNRRVQRAIDLQNRRDAGEPLDEVDTEFLEKFLAELAEFNEKGAASALQAIEARNKRRRAELELKAAAPVNEQFDQWKREHGYVTPIDAFRKFKTFLASVFIFYMGIALGGGSVLDLLR